MRSKLLVGLILAVVAVMFIASGAMAAKLLCVSKQQLKGEDTVASCLAKGEQFAYVDDNGVVHLLSKKEVELTKAFNPAILKSRAFGMSNIKDAPKIPKMPPIYEP